MPRLENKIAVVMGAGSSGPGWSNGTAAAATYLKYGATVVCVDRRAEAAAEAATTIDPSGDRTTAVQADATLETDVESVIAQTVERYGRLDILHNNVGVGGALGLPDQTSRREWDREMEQNLTTAYLSIRHAAPVMRRQGGGVITNISSTLAVRFLRAQLSGYTAAKAGLEALTRSCAVGYGRDGIRVNCIRIGFAETPLIAAGLNARGLTPEQAEQEMAASRRKVPLRGEHGTGFDAAEAAAFLASDDARYITGAVIDVDGGLASAPL